MHSSLEIVFHPCQLVPISVDLSLIHRDKLTLGGWVASIYLQEGVQIRSNPNHQLRGASLAYPKDLEIKLTFCDLDEKMDGFRQLSLCITLPPINMEPDVRGGPFRTLVQTRTPPNVRFHANWWEKCCPTLIQALVRLHHAAAKARGDLPALKRRKKKRTLPWVASWKHRWHR